MKTENAILEILVGNPVRMALVELQRGTTRMSAIYLDQAARALTDPILELQKAIDEGGELYDSGDSMRCIELKNAQSELCNMQKTPNLTIMTLVKWMAKNLY